MSRRFDVAHEGSYAGQSFTRAVPIPMTVFKPVKQVIPAASHPYLVITVGTGKAHATLALTLPAMRDYAQRIGADFVALTNQTQDWPLAEKFRVADYARHWQRTLFIDADVFIRSTAPSIFATVPATSIGIYDDTPGLLAKNHGLDWLIVELAGICNSQGWPQPPTTSCLNSGVVVISRNTADIWNPPLHPFPLLHCSEQNIVQSRILQSGCPVHRLAEPWNYQWREHTEFEGIEHAHFIHLAGMSQSHPAMIAPMLRALSLHP